MLKMQRFLYPNYLTVCYNPEIGVMKPACAITLSIQL